MLTKTVLRPLAAVLVACMTVCGVTGCSVVEKTTEVHTVHLIDSGSPINNGLKVISDDEIPVAVFTDGTKVVTSKRRLNGMFVVMPDRYLELMDYEIAIIQFLDRHRSDNAIDTMIRAELDNLLLNARRQAGEK